MVHHDSDTAQVYPAITQWEEAGISLAAALKRYQELSLSLGENLLPPGIPPKALSTRIDSALWSIQTVLVPQLSDTRTILAKWRNRFTPPIYRLPREVLSTIFTNVVFSTPRHSSSESMETTITRMYVALHNLLGVCTVWRNIALKQGTLWSIIPVMEFPSHTLGGKGNINRTNSVLARSMERSRGDLHLVVSQPDDFSADSTLSTRASQFRTVNVSTKCISVLRKVLDLFLNPKPLEPLALSDLSIYQDQEEEYYDTLPRDEDYIFQSDSLKQEPFQKLVSNLSILRVRGAQLYWASFNFSSCLTELYLQEVFIGSDSAAVGFLSALASASELRVLKIISTRTLYNGPLRYESTVRATFKIQLPKLQTLITDDLYFNTLDWLLSSISSRSHHLSLLLTWRCLEVHTAEAALQGEPQEVGWETLSELLNKVVVKDLLISRDTSFDEPWMSPLDLGHLINSVAPNLEKLWLDSWNWDDPLCSAFKHSFSAPNLVSLYITRAKVHDLTSFMGMMVSKFRSIRWMILGIAAYDQVRNEWQAVRRGHPIASRISGSLPNCRFGDYHITPPVVQDPSWRLW